MASHIKLNRKSGGRSRVINAVPKKLIGEILISLGYVSAEHINQSKRYKMQRTGKKIGECLVELGSLLTGRSWHKR